MKKNKKPLWIAMLIAALAIGAVLLFSGDEATPAAETQSSEEAQEDPDNDDHSKNAGDEHGHAAQESEEHGEGTEISAEAATASGIEVGVIGAGSISQTARLSGRVVLNQNRSAQVKARFPGIVRGVFKQIGDPVKRGEKLATVESNDSLQVYAVPSPLDGFVLQRSISVGDMAADMPIFTVADLSRMWVEFYVFAADIPSVKNGQRVIIRTLDGTATTEAVLDTIQPMAEASSQTIVARAEIDNSSGAWRSGMTVQGDAVIRAQDVAVAVPTAAIQRMENKDVVFVREGTRYEAIPVTLGIADPIWTEVTSGVHAGMEIVVKNSFMVKADIAKAGAEHGH